tara:strand:+ start:260 stop:568 length:309 start_codon:yes stop_codon:yes gene_type:complete
MTKNVTAELECNDCNTTFEVEEQSQEELDMRVRHLSDNEAERLCDCCEQGQHFPSHDDIDSEMCNANWADHTGFFITVPCSKCEQDVDINFEMTQEDFEVVD